MENKKELLMSYIKANVAPILVNFISGKDIPGAIVISADVDVKELNGHYDGADYMPPKWYNELVTNNNSKVLVIDLIDSINKEEQLKFIELLEYRKISTFELPKDCVIIVTIQLCGRAMLAPTVYILLQRNIDSPLFIWTEKWWKFSHWVARLFLYIIRKKIFKGTSRMPSRTV